MIIWLPLIFLFYQSLVYQREFIVNRRCHYDLRKYSSCNRITNVWNSLPEDIVTAVHSVNSFKNRLDKFWSTQDTTGK